MIQQQPPLPFRPVRTALIVGVAIVATIAGVSAFQSWGPSTSSAASPEPRPRNGLDPDLSNALREARKDALEDGVAIRVNSGWRSPERQQELLDEAVSEYGSTEEAARWVATPETSPHVSGDAVDVGPSAAQEWLSAHGAAYGLCQIYGNEAWHFELRPDAVDDGCPALYPDPTHDPRMNP